MERCQRTPGEYGIAFAQSTLDLATYFRRLLAELEPIVAPEVMVAMKDRWNVQVLKEVIGKVVEEGEVFGFLSN